MYLTSRLSNAHREALEQVLFFNPNQEKVYRSASLAVERYGAPSICEEQRRLLIKFDSGTEAQSLFLMDHDGADGQLVGVVVYTREDDTLVVIFLSLRADYSWGGKMGDGGLLPWLLGELLSIAGRVKGIAQIKFYLTTPPITISVDRATRP